MKRLEILIKKQLLNFKPGTKKSIEVDENNIPVEKFWRDRFKDSKFDNCLEEVKEVKPKKTLKGEK